MLKGNPTFRSIRTASIVIAALILVYAETAAQQVDDVAGSITSSAAFAPGELLVRFRPSVAAQSVDQILIEHGAGRSRRIRALDVDVLRLPPGLSVERAVEVFSRLPEVEFAEPNYILHALAPPQEIVDQWGLLKIQAPDAWSLIETRNPVLIAITDTGIDRTHSDLAPNIWQNPGEIAGDGIDNDANGFVDDTWGWDFANNDNEPFDDNGHGTIVSSVAAGVQDGSGVAGVCPWCTVAAVKVLTGEGSGTLDAVANGIVYAVDLGARIINLSLGASVGAQTLEDAVNYAWGQGALVVAAAGNDGVGRPFYPAGYANAMAVASTNVEDYHSCFSNFAEGYIAVAAPGESIAAALPNQEYGSFNGTSLSTPHVSGVAGLLFSQDPARANADVQAIIEETANDFGSTGTDAHFGAGRINAYRAVAGDTTPTLPPAGPFTDDLTASGYAHTRKLARDADGTLHLAWHSKDGSQYRVLHAASEDDGATWGAPEVVFASSAETFHPALAVDGEYIYVVFPSKDGATVYRSFFTRRLLTGGGWSTPAPLTGTSTNAVRPDIYRDPSNGRLHVVASSFDDAPYVYYTTSDDMGASWNPARQVNVASSGGQRTRYASIHANGPNVFIAGRTLEFIFLILPRYRVFAIRSTNGGETWSNLTGLAVHDGLLSGEYGASLAGDGDRLYLAYEHNGAIDFIRSDGGADWSDAENLGTGAWPSVTQRDDGQAWLMWESEGNLLLRHFTGSVWEPAETVLTATSRSKGYYPNLKLGASADRIEWAVTNCNGSPYRLMVDWRSVSEPVGPRVFLPLIVK
ncbi:MAG TPA: S8 family serine peptidase [Anaerolineae bacterium]|nr:S8 family serine peptidase [Anaerolineae bacterium]